MLKKILLATCFVGSMFLLGSCGSEASPALQPQVPTPPPVPTPTPVASSEQAGEDQSETETSVEAAPRSTPWAQENINNYLSYEEIVTRATAEGRVVWYSNSSRSRDVAEAFMARYPGIEVEVFDISSGELVERFYREYNAGIRAADLLHLADGDGTLYMEFIGQGMLHLYHPYDIVPFISPAFLATHMPMFIEYNALFYNTDYFPDGSPITSWWDLTTPEWESRVFTRHPLEHIGTAATFVAMVQNTDEMAADYERIFGRAIELSPGSPTAAHEFVRRFMANDPIFISSSGEIVRSVGRATEERFVGFGSSGGLRFSESEDLPINIVTQKTPAVGIPAISSLYITNEANNPNAAKLLVRFMTDEIGEGFEPFGTLGGWPPRADVPMHEGNVPIDSINFWYQDKEFLYFNALQMIDFLLALSN